MQSIQKQIVTPSNWTPGRANSPITGIVLHTMVGTTPSAYSRFNNSASQVSVHYGISLDGSIHQWVEEQNTAWQAGNWPVNLKTIGIEHEDNGNYNDAVRTPAEYESSSDLVADICRRYNIPCDTAHIFRHHDVIDTTAYPGGTACPDGLDTNKIIAMAKAKIGGNSMPTQAQVLSQFRTFLGQIPGYVDPTQAQLTYYSAHDWGTLNGDLLADLHDRYKEALATIQKLGSPTQLQPGVYKV